MNYGLFIYLNSNCIVLVKNLVYHKQNANILKCFFREDNSNQLCEVDEIFAT